MSTPANPHAAKPGDHILGSLSRDTEFLGKQPQWGFPIIRGAYGDDNAWERKLSAITADISESARLEGRPELMDSYTATVITDPELDSATGATKVQVRQKLLEWADREISEMAALVDPAYLQARLFEWHLMDKDKTPSTVATTEMVSRAVVLSPRFGYCIYLNQRCLDSLEEGNWPVVILVQKDWDPSYGEVDGSECEIEGCTKYDVGWVYMYLHDYWETYARLCKDSGSWDDFYSRPPWPVGPIMQSEPFGPEREC